MWQRFKTIIGKPAIWFVSILLIIFLISSSVGCFDIFLEILFISLLALFIGIINNNFRKYNLDLSLNNYSQDFSQDKRMELRSKYFEAERERKKFTIQYVIIPLFVAYLGYVVQDKFIGKKDAIIVGISNYRYNDSIDIASIYREKVINKANALLGSYNNSIYFDITTINNYENIWEALDKSWVDIAFVNSCNTYKTLKDKFKITSKSTDEAIDTFLTKYEIIGKRFSSNTGSSYSSGFLIPRKMYECMLENRMDTTNNQKLIELLKDSISSIYLFKERLSGSGYFVPINYLKRNGIDTSNEKIKFRLMPYYFDILRSDKTGKSVGVFSNDMWENLKSKKDSMTNKFVFVPIKSDIPPDLVIAIKKNWNKKFEALDKKINDFISLRNTILSESRGDVIVKSLRYTVEPIKNKVNQIKVLREYMNFFEQESKY